jgi:hypothetical protein
MVYLIVLEALSTQELISAKNHETIKRIALIAIEYHRRAKMAIYDIWLFERLVEYAKRIGVHNKYLVYHYLQAIITSTENQYTKGVSIPIEEADIADYLSCLEDPAFRLLPMYERVLEHDLF